MSIPDLTPIERELLRRSEELSVVPYADTPTEEATPSSVARCEAGDVDQEAGPAPPPEDPVFGDDTDW